MRQLRKDTPLGIQEQNLKRKYKTIKEYSVVMPLTGECTVTIKARNMEEAKRMFHAGELTDDNMTWEAHVESIEPDWFMLERFIEDLEAV